MSTPARPGTPRDEDLEALKAEFGSTHRMWRGRDDERSVSGWYATLRHNPLPQQTGWLFPTVGADIPQGLREILTGQAGFAAGRIARVLAVPSVGAGS